MTQSQIGEILYGCVRNLGNSRDKKSYFLKLPSLIHQLSHDIFHRRYTPSAFRVFVVVDPKLREIFSPAFRDRLAQQWLVGMIEPTIDKTFIDDSYANRKGKGTHKAIERLGHFMRKPSNTHYCQMDVRSFFTSIDRTILLGLWKQRLKSLDFDAETLAQIDHVATMIITQSPTALKPHISGRHDLLSSIPSHKSLFHAPTDTGLPIGSLSSQFFSNLYLNELDRYAKHSLRLKSYVRYVDDIIILGDDPKKLIDIKNTMDSFLREKLSLSLHPNKTIVQRVNQGADFLGAVVFPHHRYVRARQVRAFRAKVDFFNALLDPARPKLRNLPMSGAWGRRVSEGEIAQIPMRHLQRMMIATLNSYFGLFTHSKSFSLRRTLFNSMGRLDVVPANHELTYFCCFKAA